MADVIPTQLAAQIALILFDVDGVLTDGQLLLIPTAEGSVVEAKAFDSQDGSGIAIARRAGMKTGIISGRSSPAVKRRAEELRMDFCYQGTGSRKIEAFDEIVRNSGLSTDRICYVGDDVQDIPVLRRVGFPVAVQNACPEVQAVSAYITTRSGGHGAVREVVEFILRAQGKWNLAIAELS
jgi:3-deoxy-D-manno-octulosonate 8-phosphate phosphatase (KDO 8-P phosphatase)